jgi:hypothetical protein
MPQVIENKICVGTDHWNAALSSGMTSLQLMVASVRSVACGKSEAVTFLYLIPYPSALMYSMQTEGSETFLIKATDQNLH